MLFGALMAIGGNIILISNYFYSSNECAIVHLTCIIPSLTETMGIALVVGLIVGSTILFSKGIHE